MAVAAEVVIISGYADFNFAREAMHYGVREYLLKPIDASELLRIVTKYRQKKAGQTFSRAIGLKARQHEAQDNEALARQYSIPVQKILKIVEEELYNEQMSLKWISTEKIFLSENYLGKLFQKELGERFSAYLHRKRMMYAMKLFETDKNILIGAVAAQTGFGSNAQYFSIAFKKFTGYTPTDYKSFIWQLREKK